MTHSLATNFAAALSIELPSRQDVERYGTTPHGRRPDSICAVHEGLLVLTAAFKTPDGKPLQLKASLPPVLSLQHADAAFGELLPEVHAKGTHIPYLAGLMFRFHEREDRVVQVEGIIEMVTDLAKIEGLRPRCTHGHDRPRHSVFLSGRKRIARFGRGTWIADSKENRGRMPERRFSPRQMDLIFNERDRRLNDAAPQLVGAGSN